MSYRLYRLLAAASVLLLAACGNSRPPASVVTPAPGASVDGKSDRYGFNNKCVVLKAANGQFVAVSGNGYTATAADMAGAEPFFAKPAALGDYLLLNRAGQVLTTSATVSNAALTAANDAAVLRLKTVGDATSYPPPPVNNVEPTKAVIDAYRNFADPLIRASQFTLDSALTGTRLTANGSNALTMTAAGNAANQQFALQEVSGCTIFPEASNNSTSETYKGTTADGRVLGMADVHVHVSATNFLGGAAWGEPYSKFGVTRALADCSTAHGEQGSNDLLSAAFSNDTNGHATDGWPMLIDWPSRASLTHQAIYWKWLERAWKGGLRILVNDVVENETLCELQRNVSGSSAQNCNEMDSAGRQVGTMFSMQDYVDAQYGGRGKGWFQIVLSAAEARQQVVAGKLAVVLGIEVSNVLNCKLTYNPLRQREPFEETGSGATENSYGCTTTETGAPNEIKTQIARIRDIGIRQFITLHEFDNAFGGNGIFDDLVLNLGNRENSGGIPSGTASGPFATTTPETASGEFWTTYDCPNEGDPGFSGYLWGEFGGSELMNTGAPPPLCPYTGQGGRPGGTTACYPAARQCNARWLTPTGLYVYQKLMETGMIFDIDHLELEMKTQALELAEAQSPAYPFVSTHGTFGGTSNDQATRILKNGGFLYPSLSNAQGHIATLRETRALHAAANVPHLFGFGFGTDTNGLSAQAAPRGTIAAGKEVKYPFTLFKGAIFDALPDFKEVGPVTFARPEERDAAGNGRTWALDVDGSAHYGMLADFVEEMRQEGTPQDMADVFNSAEVYIQTWERTEAASREINRKGIATPAGILRAAPKPASP